MTTDEFKVQIALGIITEDQLKRIGFKRKYLSQKQIRLYKNSHMFSILRSFIENNNKLTRHNATRGCEGAWVPLKKLEIFGWVIRDFAYTNGAGRGKFLTLTPLGQKVYGIILQSDPEKKSVLVPIEINFEALQGHLFK